MRGAPGKKQYYCFFHGARKISKKEDLYSTLGDSAIVTNQTKKTRVRRLYTLKLLYKCKHLH